MLVSDVAHAVLATYFVQLTRGLSKCSAGTANVPLFAPAFVIDRGRCRFRVRNALHSFQRLLMLVSDADPAVCAAF